MVKVIYNLFSQAPKSNRANQHWLQSVVDGFKAISKTDNSIRVDADKHTDWCAYKIRNTSNKMKAICYSKEGFIYIEIYALPLPDTTQHLKPTFTDFMAHGKFMNCRTGIKEASEFLANYLEINNEYSQSKQPRIVLTPNNQLTVVGKVFLGGLLIDYDYDPTSNRTTVTLICPHKQYDSPVKYTHVLNGQLKNVDTENRLNGKYIIINNADDYSCMSKSIINLYYTFLCS